MRGIQTSGELDISLDKIEICPHITINGLEECESGIGDQDSSNIEIHCKICDKKYKYTFEEYY